MWPLNIENGTKDSGRLARAYKFIFRIFKPTLQPRLGLEAMKFTKFHPRPPVVRRSIPLDLQDFAGTFLRAF